MPINNRTAAARFNAIKVPFLMNKYQNPDNDPRGPWISTDITMASERSSLRYELNGKLPPKGRSWRFTKEHAEELERDGRIFFTSTGWPRMKRYLAESREDLYQFLRQLPDQAFKNESDFAQKVVPKLADALDYAELETFYEYGRDKYRADVVLSNSIESKPWIVLELKHRQPRNVADWTYQLRRYLENFECETGAIVSPDIIILISKGSEKRFSLRELTTEDIEEILLSLERARQPLPVSDQHSEHSRLVALIEAVEVATTNAAKGKSLETLARFLFTCVPSLRCKYSNLHTRSSEIDIVIEYDHSKGGIPLFEELGRYCLVECKNWSKPVGAKDVRDFIGKLDKCKVKLGVIFSKNGVTGAESGLDAIVEIRSAFERNGPAILVFSLEDIRDITDGKAFITNLDLRFDHLRFDMGGG